MIIFWVALVAGFVGSLTGLGGGMIVVPLLVLFLGVDFYQALGASVITIIATSSVASCRYAVGEHINLRVALFLASATVMGALLGAYMTIYIPKGILMVLFAFLLIYTVAAPLLRRKGEVNSGVPDPLGAKLKLNQSGYQVRHVAATYGVMAIAGLFSGLLGVGSGAMKVLAMDRMMQLPFRVSTTTSTLMIGITAVASAGVYLERGLIPFTLMPPLVLGVTLGALIGSLLFDRLQVRTLRSAFNGMILLIAIEMLYQGVWGV